MQYIGTSKSFNEFWEDRTYDVYNEDTFYSIGKEYIVFQNARPHLLSDIFLHKIDTINLRTFYNASKEAKSMENILALFFWKGKTGTTIQTLNNDRTHFYEFESVYKERRRSYIEVRENEFTHFVTITYQHPTTIKHPIYIMQYNEWLRRKTNKGLHRARVYIVKMYNDMLKSKIKDKKKRREEAKRLRDKHFKYFKVYEIHNNGFLHVHMLMELPKEIADRDFKDIIQLFAKWFETALNGVDIKYLGKKGRMNVMDYINKYLKKQYSQTGIKYTYDENGEIFYLIKKKTFYANDIPRIQSYSRNCRIDIKRRWKTQKCKKAKELSNSEEDMLMKERPFPLIKAERYELPLDYELYNKKAVYNDVNRFKRLKAKRNTHRQIKELLKLYGRLDAATAILKEFIEDKMDIIGSIVLHNDDKPLKDVIWALDTFKNAREIDRQEKIDLINKARKKLKGILFTIDTLPQEKPEYLFNHEEEIEWVEF